MGGLVDEKSITYLLWGLDELEGVSVLHNKGELSVD
jgi:hypothetical protein